MYQTSEPMTGREESRVPSGRNRGMEQQAPLVAASSALGDVGSEARLEATLSATPPIQLGIAQTNHRKQ